MTLKECIYALFGTGPKHTMKRLLIIIGIGLLLALPAVSQDLTAKWDLSTEDAQLGLDGGYRLYQSRQSGVYGAPVATTGPGVSSVTFPRPGVGRYYFVVTVFSGPLESEWSNEVQYDIRPLPTKLNKIEQILQKAKNALKKLGIIDRDQLRISE